MADSGDVSSGPGRRRRGRKAVSLLPAQQSPAERMASNRNRVLQRRLQSRLDSLTKDRRSWLFRTHIEASRFRRRAENLQLLFTSQHAPPSDLFHHSDLPCHGGDTARGVSPRARRSRYRRPATSGQLGVYSQGNRRPKTAGQPRPKTTGACSGDRQVMFRDSDSRAKTSSSEEEDTDSEDCPSTDGSDAEDETNSPAKTTPASARKETTFSPGVSGTCSGGSSQKIVRNAQSAVIRTPKMMLGAHVISDRLGSGGHAESHCYRGSHGQTSPRTVYEQSSSRHGANISTTRKRAQTALGTSWDRRNLTSSSGGGGIARDERGRGGGGGGGGGGVGGCRGMSKASYIQYVLKLERDKYEVNQLKVRNYLQSLTI